MFYVPFCDPVIMGDAVNSKGVATDALLMSGFGVGEDCGRR
jgi:hypothetical protein